MFQLLYRRLCLCLCFCLCICISVLIWIADVMSFQEMYGLRGPWGQTAVLQPTYELRPKWNKNKNKNNNNKTQNAVSRSDPLQGSDKYVKGTGLKSIQKVKASWAIVCSRTEFRVCWEQRPTLGAERLSNDPFWMPWNMPGLIGVMHVHLKSTWTL